MKRNLVLAAVTVMLAMTSCSNNSNQNTSPPAEKTPVHADSTAPDGTSIKVNDNGISVESKDGSKTNSVKVSKDSASIQISKPK